MREFSDMETQRNIRDTLPRFKVGVLDRMRARLSGFWAWKRQLKFERVTLLILAAATVTLYLSNRNLDVTWMRVVGSVIVVLLLIVLFVFTGVVLFAGPKTEYEHVKLSRTVFKPRQSDELKDLRFHFGWCKRPPHVSRWRWRKTRKAVTLIHRERYLYAKALKIVENVVDSSEVDSPDWETYSKYKEVLLDANFVCADAQKKMLVGLALADENDTRKGSINRQKEFARRVVRRAIEMQRLLIVVEGHGGDVQTLRNVILESKNKGYFTADERLRLLTKILGSEGKVDLSEGEADALEYLVASKNNR